MGHCPPQVLATEPDNLSANLLGHPVAYTLHSVQKDTRVVLGQIISASQCQCTCPQFPKVVQEQYAILEQPLYSPDLALCDIFFPLAQGNN